MLGTDQRTAVLHSFSCSFFGVFPYFFLGFSFFVGGLCWDGLGWGRGVDVQVIGMITCYDRLALYRWSNYKPSCDDARSMCFLCMHQVHQGHFG